MTKLKNYSENERYLKKILKGKISFSQGILVGFLISGILGLSTPAYSAWTVTEPSTGATSAQGAGTQSSSIILAPTSGSKVKGNKTAKESVVIGTESYTQESGVTTIGNNAGAVGSQAVAVGQNSIAGKQSVAVGADTYAKGNSSIAIGNDDIEDVYRDSLPESTIRDIYKDLYEGNNPFITKADFDKKYVERNIYSPTYSRGNGAIAIGSRTVAYGNGATALGTLSFALADGSTALGLRSFVSKDALNGVAIGEQSRVFAANSLAVGNKNESSAAGAMSYGYNAKAIGDGSIAIGHTTGANASLTGISQDALIKNLKSFHKDSNNSFLTGANNEIVREGFNNGSSLETVKSKLNEIKKVNYTYNETGDVVLQTGENVQIKKTRKKGDNSIALGSNSFSNGNNSIALGSGLGVFGNNSIGIGSLAYVSDEAPNTVALGVGAYSEKGNNVVIGTSAQSSGGNSVLIGSSATSTADGTIAIGYDSVTSSIQSIGIGRGTRAKSLNSISLGTEAVIEEGAMNSIALGTKAVVGENAENSIALGTGAVIKNGAQSSAAFGKDAMVTGDSSIALGNNTKADMDNSVALGFKSTTLYKYDPNAKTAMPVLEDNPAGVDASSQRGYVPDGSSYALPVDSSAGVISVGGWNNNGKVGLRRIINVAPGFLDTDAATVGQLKALSYVKREGNVAYYTEQNGQAMKVVKGDNGKFYAANTVSGEPLKDIEVAPENVFVGAKGTSEGTYTGTNGHTFADMGGKIVFANLKDGKIAEGSDQAVTGNQLYATNKAVAENKTNIQNNTAAIAGNATKISKNTESIKTLNSNMAEVSKSWKIAVNDGNAEKVGFDKIVRFKTDNNLKVETSNVDGNNTLTFGLKDNLNIGGISINNVKNANGQTYSSSTITGLTNTTWDKNNAVSNRAATEGQLAEISGSLGEGKVDKDLSNINDAGIKVIKAKAIEAIDVKAADNSAVTVTSQNEADKKTFTVGLNEDKIKEITGTTNIGTDYAKADASNITNNTENVKKWKDALGVSNLDLSYKAEGDTTGKTTTLSNGLTFKGDSNITAAAEDGGAVKYSLNSNLKEITSISNKENGTKITLSDSGVDLGNKKLTGIADGELNENSTDAVNGKQLFNTNKAVAANATNIDSNATRIGANENNIATNLQNIETNLASIQELQGEVSGKVNIALDNINDAGTKVIKAKAIEAIDVKAADNSAVTVTSQNEADKKTFTVGLNEDKIKEITGTTNIGTDYAKADASNITNNTENVKKWKDALGVSNLDLSYKAEGDTTGKTTTLSNGLTFKGDSNITAAAEDGGAVKYSLNSNLKEITSISNKENGTKITLSDSGVDLGNKKLTGLADGELNENSTDAVNGKQLFNTNKAVAANATNIDSNATRIGANENNIATNLQNIETNLASIQELQGEVSGKANIALDNINDTGTKVIKAKAIEAIDVKAADNSAVTVTSQNEADKKTFTVGLNEDKIKEITGTTNIGTDYAKADASNITNNTENVKKWKDALGVSNLDLSYKAEGDTTGKTTTLSNGLTFKGDSNITAAAEDGGTVKYSLNSNLKGITSISNKENGTKITLSDSGVDLGNKKLTGLAEGTDNSDAVTIKQFKDLGLDPTSAVKKPAVTYDNENKTQVTLGNGTAKVKVTNLQDAKLNNSSTDAVTGKQLFTANEKISTNETNIQTNADNIAVNTTNISKNATNIEALNSNMADVNKSWKIAVNDGNAEKVGFDKTVRFKTDNNLKVETSNVDGNNTLTFGLKDNLNIGGISINNVKNANGQTYSSSTITGLTNTTWDKNNAVSNRAATEGQLAAISGSLGEGKVDKDLSNITDAGTKVIKAKAIEAIDVKAADNSAVTVTSQNEADKKTFTVGLNEDKIKEITGTTNIGTDYAKADASNIANNTENVKKWKDALGVSNLDLSYKAEGDTTGKTTTLSNGLTFKGDNNITASTEDGGVVKYSLDSTLTGITSISNKGTGTTITINDDGVSLGNKKLTGLADGELNENSTDAVTGKQLFDANEKISTNETNIQTNADNIAVNTTKISKNTESIKTLNSNMAEVSKSWKIAVNDGNAEKVGFDKTVRFKTDDNLKVETSNADGNNTLTFGLKDNLNIGGISINNVKNADGQTYSSSTITGLTNTTWDKNNVVNNRAATEGQLAAISSSLGEGKVDKDLSNINDAGIKVIKTKAIEAIDVKAADNSAVTVTSQNEADKKTFTVGLNEDKIKEITGTTNIGTDYAKADASNIANNTENIKKWKDALGVSNLDLSYKAEGDTTGKTTTLSNGLTFKGDSNITAAAEDGGAVKYSLNSNLKGITSISNKENGTKITLSDSGVDLGNKKLTGLAEGTDNSDAVTIKQFKDLGLDPTSTVKKPAVTYDNENKTQVTLGNGTAKVKVTNLQDAELNNSSTDAVTGKQLYNEISSIKDNMGSTELSYKANNGTAQKTTLEKGLNFVNGTNTIAMTNENGVIKFNLSKNLVDIESIKGQGKTVALNKDNVDFGNQRVTGINNGTASSDAVNISQLKPIVNSLGGGAEIGTDGSVTAPIYALKTGNAAAENYNTVGDALNAVDKAIDNSAKIDASNINKDKYTAKLNEGANIDKPTGALVTDKNVNDFVAKEIGKIDSKIDNMDIGGGTIQEGDNKTVTGDTVNKYLGDNYYNKEQVDNKISAINNSVENAGLNISDSSGNEQKVNMKNDKLAFKGDKNISADISVSENGKIKNVTVGLNKNIEVEKVSITTPDAKDPSKNDPSKTVTIEKGNITAGTGDNKIEINGSNGTVAFGEKPSGTDNRLVINGKDKTISNLSEGKNDSDAVTKGQMDKAVAKASSSKLAFTDEQGNKVTEAADGKYYKESDVIDGNVKADAKEVKDSEIKTSLVDKKGSTTKPARLGNVAAGTQKTDAVNVEQLEQVRNEVYADLSGVAQEVRHNSDKINRIERSYKKGVANAMATAGVKFQEIDVNEITVGAAVGYYKDQGAVAVGVEGAPTRNLRIHGTISATPGPRPEAAASVGFSWKFKYR